MSADIQVNYKLFSQESGSFGQEATKRLTDWYDFADWLKEENGRGRFVVIMGWAYIHAVRKE